MELPKVKEAMSKDVVYCSMDYSIVEAATLMVEKNIRSIIVQNKIGNPIGLVTGGDIVKAVAKQLPLNTKVSELVDKDLISISGDSDIVDAAQLMEEKNVKRLAVSHKGELIGILTASDVLRYSPRYLNEFSKTLEKLDSIIKNL